MNNYRYSNEMGITLPYYESKKISNSSLGWFLMSPKYFKDMIDGVIEKKATPAMDNGTMVHAYLLEEHEFKKNYKLMDIKTPSSPQQKQFCLDYIDSKENKAVLKASEAFKSNYNTTGQSEENIAKKGMEMALKLKSYIKWLRLKDEGQKIISWATMNSLKITKENVRLHKKANELLFKTPESENVDIYNEFHIEWLYNIRDSAPIECKSLIDRLIIDHDNKKIILCDVKTTASINKFKSSFDEFDYGRQLAFYWFAITWFFDNILKVDISEYKPETYIIAISNMNDHSCRVFSIPDLILFESSEKINKIMAELNWHINKGLWEYTKEYYEGDGAEILSL